MESLVLVATRCYTHHLHKSMAEDDGVWLGEEDGTTDLFDGQQVQVRKYENYHSHSEHYHSEYHSENQRAESKEYKTSSDEVQKYVHTLCSVCQTRQPRANCDRVAAPHMTT